MAPCRRWTSCEARAGSRRLSDGVAVVLRRPQGTLARSCGASFAYLAREQSFAFAREPSAEASFVDDLAASDFATHPLVVAGPRVRFLGILPLVAPDGVVVGTLTVLDTKARTLSRSERTALANLATLAMARLEARRESGGQPRNPEAAERDTRALAGRFDAEGSAAARPKAASSASANFRAVLDSLAGLSPGSSDGMILRLNAAAYECAVDTRARKSAP